MAGFQNAAPVQEIAKQHALCANEMKRALQTLRLERDAQLSINKYLWFAVKIFCVSSSRSVSNALQILII